MSSNIKGKEIVDQGSDSSVRTDEPEPEPEPMIIDNNYHQVQHRQSSGHQLSRYESQKRRDWNTFCQYLNNKRPPVRVMTESTPAHILDFLNYLDQFGKTKVHMQGCVFFGQAEPPGPCTCPLKQAWGSLDALIGRLRAAYEENGGPPETNPFASGAIRMFLREVRDSQAKARGVPYKKKKKKRSQLKVVASCTSDGSSRFNPMQ